MNFDELLDKRYSVRSFKSEKVEKEKLDKILNAGRICPTAANRQPQRFYILQTDDAFRKLAQAQKMRFNAPTVIMVCSDLSKAWYCKFEEYNTAEMDASISCTYMMLEACSLGLGTLWIRCFNSEDLRKNFNLAENIKPICLLAIGYPSDDAKPNEVMHYARNDIKDIVTYL